MTKINENVSEDALKIKQEKVLLEVRRAVYSTNKVLKEAVDQMEPVILLRNVHPTYRWDYAKMLLEVGIITQWQSLEFSKK
jgi:hypothetical protein